MSGCEYLSSALNVSGICAYYTTSMLRGYSVSDRLWVCQYSKILIMAWRSLYLT